MSGRDRTLHGHSDRSRRSRSRDRSRDRSRGRRREEDDRDSRRYERTRENRDRRDCDRSGDRDYRRHRDDKHRDVRDGDVSADGKGAAGSRSLLEVYQQHRGGTSTGIEGLASAVDAYSSKQPSTNATDDVAVPQEKVFVCARCGFRCHYEVYGRRYRPISGIEFLEDVYMLRDPLRVMESSPGTGVGLHWPLILGGRCTVCGAVVCAAKSCSVFTNGKRVCTGCDAGQTPVIATVAWTV